MRKLYKFTVMSLKLALLLSLLAASAGIGFGYLLRLIISLGKKGSVELDVLEMEIAAKEEAQKAALELQKKLTSMNPVMSLAYFN